MKWYIEYKAYGKRGFKSGIEAQTGNDAIDILKSNMVIGVNKILGVWHDDDGNEGENK